MLLNEYNSSQSQSTCGFKSFQNPHGHGPQSPQKSPQSPQGPQGPQGPQSPHGPGPQSPQSPGPQSPLYDYICIHTVWFDVLFVNYFCIMYKHT